MRSPHGIRSRRLGPHGSRASGFTLIEVMVALFVTAVGLLGIAKIQALAYASTGSAGVRSLVALQAAGLAASMHANRNYWASGNAPPLITINPTTGIVGGSLNTPANCVSAGATPACATPDLVAAYDLQTYEASINNMLGNSSNPTTTINCPVIANTPINCTIQVTWTEKTVSTNAQSAAATTDTTFTPTYTLYVEP